MDLRDFLFESLKVKNYEFTIIAKENGVFSGSTNLREESRKLGLDIIYVAPEGYRIENGDTVFKAIGKSNEIVRAEELLLGLIGKTSGVATAASHFVNLCGDSIKVVCGAWKKVDSRIRFDLRQAITIGGCGIRIAEPPFIYLDKNYVRMFGSIEAVLKRARNYNSESTIVIQLRGEQQSIEEEALIAIKNGADILMIDTGNISDFRLVSRFLIKEGVRKKVKLAFSGGVNLSNIEQVIDTDVDIIDVGRAIIDAPMLDFSLDVCL